MSDRFRMEHLKLSDVQAAKIKAIKNAATDLEGLFGGIEGSRERSLALTNLEQSVMWATKGITG